MLAPALLLVATRPRLAFDDPAVQARLGVPFEAALDNLLRINTVPFDPKVYNRTGRMRGKLFVRAGGGYAQPWTRDASINAWNAASLLEPEVARDTLWAVTENSPEGPVVQRDNQWWDKVIWIIGGWNHVLATGDREFLRDAYGVSARLLKEMRAARYDAETGLFRGPSFFNDGIAGYPSPPARDDDGGSSFVLDHAGADRVEALSTNALYVGAYRAAAEMAKALGESPKSLEKDADALKAAVTRRFWMPDKGTYGYLLVDGKLDPSQEGAGLAFAALFDVAPSVRARAILRDAHVEPYGITDVWPHFPRFSDARPGRHNAIVWPMVQGMWARAAAKTRDAETFGREMSALAGLAEDGKFWEIYNAKTGKVDGGWQNGHAWGSEPDQTWSATAYLSMVTNGLFGVRFGLDGLRFEPTVPKGWDGATLADLPYRASVLTIRLRGEGVQLKSLTLDGKRVRQVPASLTGAHTVEIVVS